MPFPFALPTTSSFSFSSCFESDTHPSLPLNASTYRGVVRETLKKHKRLPALAQIGNLTTVTEDLKSYLPYLLAVDGGLNDRGLPGVTHVIRVTQKSTPTIKWRPTLSGDFVPGRERSRVRISTVEHELAFVLISLGFTYVLAARSSLQPLYLTSGEFVASQERTKAVATASKQLLEAASVYSFLASRIEQVIASPPCVDVSVSTVRAMASLAHAEATILAVFKDDPYPAAVAQDRSKNDKEWMFKSPEIPKVRAHLYARLCLAAAQHAAKAASLIQSIGTGTNKIDSHLSRYMEDFRRTARAKACRFLGIDAELGGQTAEGIGWLQAGLQELGVDVKDSKKGLSLGRFKKELMEKREDRRVEKELGWGSDGGKLEETRVIEMLAEKWNKVNDTMNTKAIPPVNSLVTKMPSGREIHDIPPFHPPSLTSDILESMRAPPDVNDEFGHDMSSDEDYPGTPPAPSVGGFPGAPADYTRSSTATSHTYY